MLMISVKVFFFLQCSSCLRSVLSKIRCFCFAALPYMSNIHGKNTFRGNLSWYGTPVYTPLNVHKVSFHSQFMNFNASNSLNRLIWNAQSVKMQVKIFMTKSVEHYIHSLCFVFLKLALLITIYPYHRYSLGIQWKPPRKCFPSSEGMQNLKEQYPKKWGRLYSIPWEFLWWSQEVN